MNLRERLDFIFTIIKALFVRDTDKLYEVIGSQAGLGDYLNQGWWDEDSKEMREFPDSFNMANRCEELVRKVAETAELTKDDRILDVGFGLGEQDRLIANEYSPRSLEGLNITHAQVVEARDKVSGTDLDQTISFLTGNAVELPFERNTYDVILAVESAFHFRTREQFFSEARRVLKPNGRLVTADIIYGHQPGEGSFLQERIGSLHNSFWKVPEENHIISSGYETLYRDHGFENVKVRDVTDNVLKPGITNYIRWRNSQLPFLVRVLFKPIVSLGTWFYNSGYLRYVLTRGDLTKAD